MLRHLTWAVVGFGLAGCQVVLGIENVSPAGDASAGADSGASVAVLAPANAGVTINADLSDWSDQNWYVLHAPDDYVALSGGTTDSDDLSVSFAVAWRSDLLYLAFDVTDETHRNAETGDMIWDGDSVQIGLDMADNGGRPYDATDDYEYGWAVDTDFTSLRSWRWYQPAGAPAQNDQFAISRLGDRTIYEIALQATELRETRFMAGQRFGFSTIVNDDDDGSGRVGFVELTPGLGQGKDPGEFGALILID